MCESHTYSQLTLYCEIINSSISCFWSVVGLGLPRGLGVVGKVLDGSAVLGILRQWWIYSYTKVHSFSQDVYVVWEGKDSASL